MHILHVQSMQVYATPSFDAVSPWQPAVDSWDLACVLCARDMVTEMDVALHAISVKCHVHHVRAKNEQRFRKVGLCQRRRTAKSSRRASAATASSTVVGRSQRDAGDSAGRSDRGRAVVGGRVCLEQSLVTVRCWYLLSTVRVGVSCACVVYSSFNDSFAHCACSYYCG